MSIPNSRLLFSPIKVSHVFVMSPFEKGEGGKVVLYGDTGLATYFNPLVSYERVCHI